VGGLSGIWRSGFPADYLERRHNRSIRASRARGIAGGSYPHRSGRAELRPREGRDRQPPAHRAEGERAAEPPESNREGFAGGVAEAERRADGARRGVRRPGTVPGSQRQLPACTRRLRRSPLLRDIGAGLGRSRQLGVLNDMSSLYAEHWRQGFGPRCPDGGRGIWRQSARRADRDRVRRSPDIGAGIARKWIDTDHVDAIVDVPTSSVALAIQEVTREKNRLFLMSGPASSDLTGKACSPYGIQWTYDTYALAHGTGGALVKQGHAGRQHTLYARRIVTPNAVVRQAGPATTARPSTEGFRAWARREHAK
jgi:hypothetical protein